MEKLFQYQRLLLGYHGCDQSLADDVLNRGAGLQKSENSYDWLGSGIYFWEHGPERALEWAEEQQRRGKIENPAVVGAVLHLGRCFDLLDRSSTKLLAESFEPFCSAIRESGLPVPENAPISEGDSDRLYRKRDCAVINWALRFADRDTDQDSFDSVRGMFQEDEPVFEGSDIRRKSHIQIAVRNPSCILGYFRPA